MGNVRSSELVIARLCDDRIRSVRDQVSKNDWRSLHKGQLGNGERSSASIHELQNFGARE